MSPEQITAEDVLLDQLSEKARGPMHRSPGEIVGSLCQLASDIDCLSDAR